MDGKVREGDRFIRSIKFRSNRTTWSLPPPQKNNFPEDFRSLFVCVCHSGKTFRQSRRHRWKCKMLYDLRESSTLRTLRLSALTVDFPDSICSFPRTLSGLIFVFRLLLEASLGTLPPDFCAVLCAKLIFKLAICRYVYNTYGDLLRYMTLPACLRSVFPIRVWLVCFIFGPWLLDSDIWIWRQHWPSLFTSETHIAKAHVRSQMWICVYIYIYVYI